MPLDRSAIRPVQLPAEEVEAPAIGGPVLVRGMDMPQLLRFTAEQRAAGEPLEGEHEDVARARAGMQVMSLLLHMVVLAGDGEPVYSQAEWQSFALAHMEEAQALYRKALELSGQAVGGGAEAPKP